MGRSKGTAFGQEEVAGVFRLPEGKKIYPEHNFDKTNMAKGEKLPLEDPQMSSTGAGNSMDVSFRVMKKLSLAAGIDTTPLTYKSTFNSTTKRAEKKNPTYPGYLEYGTTPRAAPSIERSIKTPAKSVIGAEHETSYRSAFNSKYEWPKIEVKEAQGGSVLKTLDSMQGKDGHGNYPVTEMSIAREVLDSKRAYSSAFRSKAPLGVPLPTPQTPAVPYRERDEMDHPMYLRRSIEASPQKYSMMTNERGSQRVKPKPSETADIADFYDGVQTYGPKADLASQIERSPVKYSNFNMSKSHIGEVFRRQVVDSVSQEVNYEDDPERAERSEQRREREERRRPKTSIEGPSNTLGGSQPRFLPDGHPMSMFGRRSCNKEFYRAYEHRTIARDIVQSPIHYSGMWSPTGRSGDRAHKREKTSVSPTSQSPQRPAHVVPERSATAISPFYQTGLTYWGAGGDTVGGVTLAPGDALASSRTGGGRKASSLDATCTMLSSVNRFPEPVNYDPRETNEHKNRRQHLLESRIGSLRENHDGMSKKLRQILNL